MPDRRLYSILTIAGATPFVAAAILVVAGNELVGPRFDPRDIAVSYGLAIACFLAGVHWATRLYVDTPDRVNLFIVSNAVVLGCWIPYVIGPAQFAAAALIAAFLVLLLVDARLKAAGIIDAHYFRIRCAATGLVVVSLAVVALVP